MIIITERKCALLMNHMLQAPASPIYITHVKYTQYKI